MIHTTKIQRTNQKLTAPQKTSDVKWKPQKKVSSSGSLESNAIGFSHGFRPEIKPEQDKASSRSVSFL